jgi:hypothetical protein
VAITDRRTDFFESMLNPGAPIVSDLSAKVIGTADAQVIYLDPTREQLAYRFAQSERGWEALELDTGTG